MTQPLTDGPVYRPNRVRLVRAFCRLVMRSLFSVRLEGAENLAHGPAIYCANHLNWTDPLVLLALLPNRPKFAMFGPKEADMSKGGRNRLITWAGFGIPYRPEKTDLLETTRRVHRILADGWIIVIMGEGRIHRGEHELMPLADGVGYFAIRSGVPVVPVAINGTSWLGLRRRIRVRVGAPIRTDGRATREAVEALRRQASEALLALVADFPEPGRPGPASRWLTELFNDWPEGARPEAGAGDAAGTDLASRAAKTPRPPEAAG
ncbi:MAG: lysophospholipid acyltransferase family protein [Chloroflexota bacterium]